MSPISVQDALTSPQAAHAASAVTTTTGLATLLEMIPPDIGTVGSALGIVSTIVLLFIQIKRYRMDRKRFEIEMSERGRKL